MNWRSLLKIDTWAAVAYGFGHAASFALWVSVAYVILVSQLGTVISPASYFIAAVLGAWGTYWYSVRKYEKVVE